MAEPKQIVPWDTEPGALFEEIAYWSKLDDKYMVEVQRVEPYHGLLCIFENEKLVYKVDVTIGWDALFGPDFEDVNDWQEIAMKWADERVKIN